LIDPAIISAAPAKSFHLNLERKFASKGVALNHRSAAAERRTVEISPEELVARRPFDLVGVTFEIVQTTRREKFGTRYCGSRHLLVVCEQGGRIHGDTFVDGLPPSSLKDINRRLTFVPAGLDYHEWQEPRIRSRIIYFYFDPARMPTNFGQGFSDFAPRLYFEDSVLWETTVKLSKLAESTGADSGPYLQALSVILAHELVRLHSGSSPVSVPVRGGLASWQERLVASYIEDHLAERISLTKLASLVNLSPYYFCRAFKQSFGAPPHRYHTGRRIERAKSLLGRLDLSVTDIGLTVGFSETSSFSTAFRKATGLSPTDYRRSSERHHERDSLDLSVGAKPMQGMSN
jgi:AraC family transcriptional regulator